MKAAWTSAAGTFLPIELDVRRGAGVVGHDAVEAEVGGGAGGGVDAHVAHRAADGEPLRRSSVLEFLEQPRLAEAVGEVFHDDRFVRAGGDRSVNLRAGVPATKNGADASSQVCWMWKVGCFGAAEVGEQLGGVRGRLLDLVERHLPAGEVVVLDVDDDEGGFHCVAGRESRARWKVVGYQLSVFRRNSQGTRQRKAEGCRQESSEHAHAATPREHATHPAWTGLRGGLVRSARPA